MRIALATFAGLPELDPDDQPLLAAFAGLGATAEPVRWDEPEVAWGDFAAVLIRSTWDYYRRPAAFLAWAERVATVSRLFNPLPLVRWNTDKHYLSELSARGAPVIPGVVIEPGERVDLARLAADQGWAEVVVKPTVSADSWEAMHVPAGGFDSGQAHLDRLLAERAMLVQPFLPSVESWGERCLVFLDGELAHAVRKNPLTRGGRWAGLPEGVPVSPADDERAAAAAILDLACPGEPPLYARVDLVRDGRDRPVLLELELTEPTLFLEEHPGAAERLAAALLRRAGLAG